MKRPFLYGLFISLLLAGCKDKGYIIENDDAKNYNLIQVTDGPFKGETYRFSPNQGFWSESLPHTYYFHLVLGDTDNSTFTGSDIMSLVFIYKGENIVEFPSIEGREIQLGLVFDNTVYMFKEKMVVLTILSPPTKEEFNGHIEGEFMNQWDSTMVITAKMDIRISLKELFPN